MTHIGTMDPEESDLLKQILTLDEISGESILMIQIEELTLKDELVNEKLSEESKYFVQALCKLKKNQNDSPEKANPEGVNLLKALKILNKMI